MPIDWNNFDKASADAAQDAAKQTDTSLADQITSLTTLSKTEIETLFPEQNDQKALGELMQIVAASTSRNEKIAAIASNGERFGGIILTLLGKFV